MKNKISVSIEDSIYSKLEEYKMEKDYSMSKAVEEVLLLGLNVLPKENESFKSSFQDLIISFERTKGLFDKLAKKKYTKSIPNNNNENDGIPKV